MFSQFRAHQSGNVIVPFALIGVVLVTAVGGGLDLMSVANQKSSLKSLADNAALSAVNELAIVSNDTARIKAVAEAYVDRNAEGESIAVSTDVDWEARTVKVSLNAEPRTYFPGPVSSGETLRVASTAKLAGTPGNVCMIGLSPVAISTLQMKSKSRITAEQCAIYSNSTSALSMTVNPTARVKAELICVAGGYAGRDSTNSAHVIEDCQQIQDPLASRPQPKVGACTFKNVVVKQAKTLKPGVYCGGLIVDGGTADLKAGVYIIKGGQLLVTNGGTLRGDDVGFYLADPFAKIGFDYKATIDIAAPRDGIMAGMLIMSAPYQEALAVGGLNNIKLVDTVGTTLRVPDGVTPADHTIRSDNARRLVGTIYLPNGKLLIDGKGTIADRSDYTVIVADTFELRDGPNLVIRTDYDQSAVPLPEGVGPQKDAGSVLIE